MLNAAFTGKSSEIYSDLTESQKTELGRKVKQFIEANENEENGILEVKREKTNSSTLFTK